MKDHLAWIVPLASLFCGALGFFVVSFINRRVVKDDRHDDKIEKILVGMARIETKVDALPCLKTPYPPHNGSNGVSNCPESHVP